MASGRVKWFGPKKGHGFIRDDESGEDVFAHFSSMGGSGFRALEEGKAVLFDFDMVEGEKGLQARNVVRTGPYNRAKLKKAQETLLSRA